MNNKLVGILLLIAIIVGGSVIYYNQHSGSGTWIKGNSEDVQKDSNRSNSSQDTSNTPEPRKALIGANPMVLAQTMVSFLKENGSPNLEVNMDAYKKGLDAYNSQKYADALSYLSGIDTDDRDPFLLVLTENSKIMAEESEYVEIAVAGPMTGDSWQKGLAELYGAALAQQEINLAGGISGKKVIVDIADDKGQTGKSTTDTARSIVNSKVLAVVGHIGSANTLAAAPLYEKAGLPAISPSSSSPLVSKAGEFIFRVCSDDNAQGRALVKYALDTGAKQAAIVYMPTDAYSMTLHDAVKKEAGTTGLAINKEYKYQKGAMDFADIAAQIKASGVDSVFFCGNDVEGSYFLIDLKRTAPNVRALGGDGMYIHSLLEVAGASSEGLISTTFYHAKAGFPFQAHFTQTFTDKFKGTPNARSALAYDAVYAIANALNDTQQFSRRGVYEGLKNVSFQGATGRIKFDNQGDVQNKPIVILETRNLEYLPVKSVYE